MSETSTPETPPNQLGDVLRANLSDANLVITTRLTTTLQHHGFGGLPIDSLASTLSTIQPSNFVVRIWQQVNAYLTELGDIFHFARHIFVTTALFLLISLAAVALQIYLHTLHEANLASDILTSCLIIAKYGILFFDLALLFYRLAHTSWCYARSLTWK